VAISRPGGTRDNANLFVTHIPAKWTSEILQHNFSIFGEVVEARILEKEGTSRLCGFVRYNKSEDALKALRHRDGWTPPRTHRQLKVTLATKPQSFTGCLPLPDILQKSVRVMSSLPSINVSFQIWIYEEISALFTKWGKW